MAELVQNDSQTSTVSILVRDDSGNQTPAVSVVVEKRANTHVAVIVDVHNATIVAANLETITAKVMEAIRDKTTDAAALGIPVDFSA